MSATTRPRSPRGQGERLRGEILDATESLLIDTPDPEAVSIRAVAEKVGVTAPTIYRHFEDKESLITAVCARAFGEIDVRLAEHIGEEGDAIERLRLLGEAYVEFGLSRPSHYRAMMMDKSFGGPAPATLAELSSQPNGFPRALVECERAIAEGVQAPDALTLALHLWTTVHGIVCLRIAMPHLDWPPVERELDLLAAQMRSSVVPPTAPAKRARRR